MEALKIKILIEADGAGVGRGMSLATASVVGFERAATSSLKRVTTAFAGLSNTTKILGGLGLGLGAIALGLGQVIGPAIDFESAFAGVLKTVDGTTGQLSTIRTGLIELSTVMPTSASELASIAENAGQLGVAAGDVLEFTEVVAQLGETTDLDFDSAAQSLARFLNVTGNDATIRQLGDVIVELGNNSATTESQIVTFGTRLASAFNLAGATEDQILAIGAAFSSLGVEAEAGSSALSRVITQIADAAKLGGEDLEVFAETAGLIPEEFAKIAAENPVEALVLFGEGLGRVADEGRSITPILEQLGLDGIRTSRVMQLLAVGSDQIRDSLELASAQFENGGAAQEEYSKRTATTASRLEILQGRLTAVAIAAGTPLLSGFAQGADLAGDAIERLVELLGPLAGALGETFSNLARSAQFFFDTLGGPALGLAVAGLNGLIVALTSTLVVLNSLGPVGLVIGALLALFALFPAQVGLAATAVGVFGLELQALGARGAVAAAGVKAFQAAIIAGPLIALAGALVLAGKAFFDADTAARGAAEGFREALDSAIDTGSLQNITAELDRVQERIDRLSEGEGRALEITSWNDWGTAIKGTAQILTPFTENTVLNAQKELERLNSELDASRMGVFGDSVALAAQALGISEDAVIGVADEMGLLGDLTQGTTAQFYEAVDAIDAATIAERTFSEETGLLFDKLITGTATFAEIAEAIGVTEEGLTTLVKLLPDVDFSDFEEGSETMLDAAEAAQELDRQYGAVAETLGISSQEYAGQVESVIALAEAHDQLAAAIAGANSAMEQINDAHARLTASRDEYNEAFAVANDVDSFVAAAEAAGRYVTALAGTGAPIGEVIALQGQLADELIEVGRQLGLADEEIALYGAALLGIPPSVLTELIADADAANLTVEDFIERALRVVEEGVPPLELTADGSQLQTELDDKIAQARAAADDEYDMKLTATDAGASDLVRGTGDFATSVAHADYIMRLEAADAGASSEIEGKRLEGRNYADAKYEALMRARDAGASSEIADKVRQARAFGDGRYNARLTATDLASRVIRGAIATLSRFRSKSITITTFLSTIARKADGGIIDGGVEYYRAGGLGGVPLGAVPERPGTAGIYRPVSPGRLFAEPETGGEAYIPLAAAKRARSLGIWEETGRLLGVLANGGIQSFQNGGLNQPLGSSGFGGTQVLFSPNIVVSISGLDAGLTPDRVALEVERGIDRAMDRTARQLANLRS